MKIRLTHDVYEISKRIKYLDNGYFIVYNTSTCKFEVHNSNQLDTTYCLTLPYSYLDERSLNYVAKTRCANIEQILEEIEQNNKIQESSDASSVLTELNELANDNFKEW